MKVFADNHHEALFESLRLLFVGRLGYEIYQPTGMDWFPNYWHIGDPYPNPRETAEQYLLAHHPTNGITLEEFKDIDFDLIIASIPAHVKPFSELIRLYQPNAKLIYQIGNNWQIDFDSASNFMISLSQFSTPTNKNVVFYHQEFEVPPFVFPKHKLAHSFVHLLPTLPDYADYQRIRDANPKYEFRNYGAGCDDGPISREQVPNKMLEASWGVHLKSVAGEGYGHVIHQWFAIGRPVVVRRSQYQNKLAQSLMIDGQTCIDLDQHPDPQIDLLESEIMRMCLLSRLRFEKYVNFEEDQWKVEKFLEKLI